MDTSYPSLSLVTPVSLFLDRYCSRRRPYIELPHAVLGQYVRKPESFVKFDRFMRRKGLVLLHPVVEGWLFKGLRDPVQFHSDMSSASKYVTILVQEKIISMICSFI